MKWLLAILTVAVSFALVSCGSSTAPTTFSIGGIVSGLSGTGLVLQDNGGDNLPININGSFTFATALASGSVYRVTVLTQPTNPAQTCTVPLGGSGTATSAVVTAQVVCATNNFTLGGTVTGLTGSGLVLQDNASNNLPISANGSYSFPTAIPNGNGYNVTTFAQPSGQTCNVSNGFGASITGNITNVSINCFNTTVTFTIGGMVSGLSGAGLVLQNNSGDNLAVSKNGAFTFATPIASGSAYSVTALTQPASPTQNCMVTGGGGTASTNITGVQITCATATYSIGGTISGLTGSGLVLQNNGGNNLPISANTTSFVFNGQVASGASYAVTVLTQPSGPNCSIANGSGKVVNSGISNIAINCAGGSFNISATVSGLLANTSVVLQDNAGDNLTISANGLATNFNTPIATGGAYAVTVLTQPSGATCTAGSNASGKVAGADINVAVTCGVTMTASLSHTCALTAEGTMLCWGSNEYGQLGNGSTANSTAPVPVVGIGSAVVSIAAGRDFTCALTSAGSVWCWGDNGSGQLGNGTYAQSTIPVEVLDSTGKVPLGGAIAIAAGERHTCAVTNAGAALCWGDNSKGELGTGSEIGSNLPTPVSGISSGTATVSAGTDFTCAATTSGSVSCWGEGSSGQLGNGTATSSSTPATVLDSTGKAPLSGVVAVSAGFENSCALTNIGTMDCWGANSSGQLGTGKAGAASGIPVAVMNSTGRSPLTGVVAISSGLDDSCAITTDGKAMCWGANENGQLGNGNTTNASMPLAVSGLSGGVTGIASGYQHTCAVTSTGAAECWGSNLNGQLASGNTAPSSTPVEALGVRGVGFLRLF
jgi:alpha-tubulin suppressor-like RCC1 family protein